MVVLQSVPSGSASQVAGTIALLAVFFAVTAHVAARNVLGDVERKKALAVGPVIPTISFVFVALRWPALVAVPLALVADFALFRALYTDRARLAGYLTLIHVVVSIILGVIVFGVIALVQNAPG